MKTYSGRKLQHTKTRQSLCAVMLALMFGFLMISQSVITAPSGKEPKSTLEIFEIMVDLDNEELTTTDHEVASDPTANTTSLLNGVKSFQVRFENNLLTVKADEAPLKDLMKEISRRAYIAIELGDGVETDRISAEFTNQPLDAGLRQLLAGHDVFSYHRGDRGLLTIWIYAKLEGRGIYPIPFETWASTADLQQRLDDYDAAERVAALEALVDRGGALSERAVIKALDDEDERVRTMALYEALNEDFALPPEMLSDLAFNDSSHNVRFLALKSLAGTPTEEQVALAALNDPNLVIRNYAESVLNRLYPAGDLPDSGQQTQNSNQLTEKRR